MYVVRNRGHEWTRDFNTDPQRISKKVAEMLVPVNWANPGRQFRSELLV